MSRILDSLAVVVAVGAIGGCAGTQQGADRTFGGYTAALHKQQAEIPVLRTIGKISLVPEPTGDWTSASTAPGMTNQMLHFEGVTDGRVCFGAIDDSIDIAAYEAPEARLKRIEIWVEAVDDLEAIRTRPLRPSPGVKLDAAEIESEEVRLRNLDYQRVHTTRWKLCGPLPPVTAQTRYLAVVIHDNSELYHPDTDKLVEPEDPSRDGLILWEITAAP